MALSPVPQRTPVIGPNGLLTAPWAAFFRDLYQRVGGATGTDAATVASNLADHLADTVDAHDASAISNLAAGSISSTTVQAAINELSGDIDGHIADTTDAHDASAISYSNGTSGLTADDVQEAIDELDSDIEAVAASASFPTGTVAMYFGTSAPSGWVLSMGATIGDGSSGATGRANADTESLFTHLWNSLDNTALPIQDSSGAATTRGASAADDFAAHKRLPTPNFTGLVPRGTGTQAVNGRNKVGPSRGVSQEDSLQGHYHTLTVQVAADAAGGGGVVSGSTSIAGQSWPSFFSGTNFNYGDTGNGSPRTGDETRASALGVNFIMKL
jgi:hypothetical protein